MTVDRMPLIGACDVFHTRDEPWWDGDVGWPWYEAAADFAVENLGTGAGRKCLVIGSPISEAKRLRESGWDTLYIDCRRPPPQAGKFIVADATAIPVADSCFDAVSSTCVLCHVGLGRYGDKEILNGDVLAMAEIARVMRPGALATITIGPALPSLKCSVRHGNLHRIYRPSEVGDMASGLEVVRSSLWSDGWLTDAGIQERVRTDKRKDLIRHCYLSVVMRRLCK